MENRHVYIFRRASCAYSILCCSPEQDFWSFPFKKIIIILFRNPVDVKFLVKLRPPLAKFNLDRRWNNKTFRKCFAMYHLFQLFEKPMISWKAFSSFRNIKSPSFDIQICKLSDNFNCNISAMFLCNRYFKYTLKIVGL